MTKGFRADLVPGTTVPSYFMAIMNTSTIFAVCGITCGLLSATLGFAGKTTAGRTVRTRSRHLEPCHTRHGQTGRQG